MAHQESGISLNGNAPSELIRGWGALSREVKKGRVQLWRDIRAGTFPAPIELGANSVGWYRSEVEEWKRSRPRRTYGRTVTAAPEAA
jgi:predicted DNA-binding transcriptional regulator AlpA